jgi:hypothetical protein
LAQSVSDVAGAEVSGGLADRPSRHPPYGFAISGIVVGHASGASKTRRHHLKMRYPRADTGSGAQAVLGA